jgi:ornithine carbamoyltransferase
MAPNGTFNGTTWTSLGTADADQIYTSTFSAQTVSPNTTTAAAITGAHSQIMIPQAVSPVTAYASTAANAKPNNAYIAIQYTAQNTAASESIVGTATWAIWKIPAVTWEAGKQYTYVIDIADGGYFETNTNDGDSDLDPVLSDGYIKFANVSITDWDTTPGDIPASF